MSSLVGKLANARCNSVPLTQAPPLSKYETWFEAFKATQPTAHGHVTASQCRRIAQLRRAHDTWAEIARCVGLSKSESAKRAWLRLPPELR